LGAVVFGGLLALGVLWLLVTAPGSEGDQAWSQPLAGPESNGAPVLVESSRN